MADVKIRITAQDAGAHQALSRVAADLAKTAGEADKLSITLTQSSRRTSDAAQASDRFARSVQEAGRSTSGFQSTLQSGGAALFFFAQNAQLAANLARQGFDAINEGARSIEIRDAFAAQLSASGQSLDEFVAKLREASSGTISDTQLMATAAKAISLGVATSADDAAELLEIARFKARRFGIDTATAFNDIVTGIGRASPLILDNLGIVFDAEGSYKAYAASVGKSVEALTEAEKKQILLNQVLKTGREEIEAAGGLIDTQADKLRQFQTEIDNAIEKWKQLAAVIVTSEPEGGGPSAVGAVGQAATTAQQLEVINRASMAAADAILRSGDAAAAVSVQWRIWTGDIDGARRIMEQFPGATQAFDEAAMETARALGLVSSETNALTSATQAANPELGTAANVAREQAAAATEAAAQTAALNQILADLGPAAFGSIAELDALRQKIIETGAAATATGAAALQAIGVLRQMHMTQPELFDPNLNTMTPSEARAAGNVRMLGPQMNSIRDAERVIVEENKRNTREWFSNWQKAQQQAASAAKKASSDAEKAYEKALREMEREAQQRFDNIKSAVQSALDLSGSVGPVDSLLDQFGLRQEGPGEIVRRLQSVVNEGATGGGKQWAEFYANLLGFDPQTMNLTNDEIRARAAKLIQDIQSGLRPDLIDRGALKEQARAIFIGQRNLQEVIDEVAQDLAAEGFGDATGIKAQLSRTMGVPIGEALSEGVATGFDTLTQTTAPQLQSAMNELVTPAVDTATVSTATLTSTIGGEGGLVSTVSGFVEGAGAKWYKLMQGITDQTTKAREEFEKYAAAVAGFTPPEFATIGAGASGTGTGTGTGVKATARSKGMA